VNPPPADPANRQENATMKGNDKVITQLQRLLRSELAARDQYFIHSRICRDWGYEKLYERLNHEMEEETRHADALISRILFLEGMPEMKRADALNIGGTVPDILRNDLALEYEVMEDLRKAIKVCEEKQDYHTRELLRGMLADSEEDHAYWLERQLGLIEAIGLENYLQSRM
jgi:bacterioferritin